MNGAIDDVRIYSRALSASEIQHDMSTALGGGGSSPPDTTAPSVSLAAPSAGATVAGAVSISANASDNVGVVGVQFKVDAQNIGAEVQSAPYNMVWNTAQWPNGSHSLAATARDAAGNSRTSASVAVVVDNGSVAPPPAPTLSFTANPTTVVSGGGSTLTWSSANATSCSASGAWSGAKATSGSQSTGALTSARTYSLSCTGPGGTTSRSVTVR